MIKEKEYQNLAKLFKDLSNPIRLKILFFLTQKERCLCEMLPYLKISQPALSRHLSILKEHNIIRPRREKTKKFYKLVDKRVISILNQLMADMSKKDWRYR